MKSDNKTASYPNTRGSNKKTDVAKSLPPSQSSSSVPSVAAAVSQYLIQATSQLQSDESTDIADLVTLVNKLASDNEQLRNLVIEQGKRIDTLEHKLNEVSSTRTTTHPDSDRLAKLEVECAKTDQYSRRSTIVVSGLAVSNGETSESLSNAVCKAISSQSVTVTPRDLQACHRNGTSKDNKPPSVTVRLYDYGLKDRVLRGYSNFDKATKSRRRVTVTQSLNPYFRDLKAKINEKVGTENIRYIHYRSPTAGLVVRFKNDQVIQGETVVKGIFCMDSFSSQIDGKITFKNQAADQSDTSQ